MSDTDRIQRWRQRMREQGKEPVTLWLSREVKLRLADLAATSRSTTAEIVEQALAHFQPGSHSVTATVADTAQLRVLMEEAVLETTAVTELVTDIVTATLARDLPPLVHAAIQDLHPSSLSDAFGTATNENVADTAPHAPPSMASSEQPSDNSTTGVQHKTTRGRHKLTPRQVRALRDKHLRGVPVPALLEEYGISRASLFRYLQSDKRAEGG
jgi:predicted transcriptional regulator